MVGKQVRKALEDALSEREQYLRERLVTFETKLEASYEFSERTEVPKVRVRKIRLR